MTKTMAALKQYWETHWDELSKVSKANYDALDALIRADERERVMASAKAMLIRSGVGLRCDDLHHVPKDQHGAGEDCPVEARVRTFFGID